VFPQDRYPFPEAAVRERWRLALVDPAVEVVIAEVAGRAVGIAAIRPEWLDGLYLVPELWGRGVGGRLHDHAVARLRGLGCERCHLWVLEENPRARRFYEQRGWQLNGETRVVPFPPNPIDVGYTLVIGARET
jgi:GNAT superfamily N-acetyltransferase